ncbi:MAG: hypothetical protein R3305_11235 [Gammaproteobacteria bacterium]|nr:hypothetical protein [Gammaproteobacteria bacterium]
MKRAQLSVVVVLLAVSSSGCGGGEPGQPTAAERAVDELQARFDELADGRSGEAIDWAEGDIENIGDWEYRIVEFETMSAEVLQQELNALGDERWEVFWVESTAAGVRMFLKRPAISYLSRVPLSTLLRMLAPGGQ